MLKLKNCIEELADLTMTRIKTVTVIGEESSPIETATLEDGARILKLLAEASTELDPHLRDERDVPKWLIFKDVTENKEATIRSDRITGYTSSSHYNAEKEDTLLYTEILGLGYYFVCDILYEEFPHRMREEGVML